jgi:hypothetical protein
MVSMQQVSPYSSLSQSLREIWSVGLNLPKHGDMDTGRGGGDDLTKACLEYWNTTTKN